MTTSVDTITFAIGDIHGCLKELEALVELLNTYYPHDRYPNRKFIFLGDYIDRGTESKGVIDFINTLYVDEDVISLKGNHEDMYLECADLKHLNVHDFGYCDPRTLQSFGVFHPSKTDKKYLDWMKERPIYHDDGLRFFVHAGVSREPLHESSPADMMWIREIFLRNPFPWSRYVVHGHTPLPTIKPDMRDNRLNLDTSCVFGGALTAAIFNNKQAKPIDFIQVPAYQSLSL